jgi:hypothetical protein
MLAIGSLTRIQTTHDIAALQVIVDCKIPHLIPLHGEMSYADIAAKVGIPQCRAHNSLRHSMTFYVFRESFPG